MSYRRSLFVILIVALCIPLVRAHATLDDLFQVLPSWQREMEREAAELDVEEENNLFVTDTDLFPEVERESSSVSSNEPEEAFVTFVEGGNAVMLRDVPLDAWFAPYVREIAVRGIVTGYRDAANRPLGLFGPGDNVTIEQLSKIVLLMVGQDMNACPKESRNETAAGRWSLPYIACAEQNGWTVYADGTVDVGRNATRAEVVMTVLQAGKVNISERTGNAFTDVTLSTQFGAAIEQAKRDGIVSGYTDAEGNGTGIFGPLDPVKRAEIAKIITKALQQYKH